MRFHIPSYLLASLSFFSKLSSAQVNSAFNPLANPGCSTVESIVESCAPKIGTQATVSSVAFSCLCYDNAGNYAPTIYGNAATTCTDYILSVFSTTGNAFAQYAAGFCTDPSFAPVKTTPPVTTPTVTGAGASSSGSAPAQTGTTSTPVTVLPGGSVSTSSSSSTTSATNTSVASPATTKGSSSSSGSGSGSASGAGGSVTSTSSKAEGVKMAAAVRGGSIWSLLGSLLAAVFIL